MARGSGRLPGSEEYLARGMGWPIRPGIEGSRAMVLISVLLTLGTLLLLQLYPEAGWVGVVALGLLAMVAAREAYRRVELQRVAARNTAELEAILESIPGMVVVGDEHGIKRANTRALELQGLSRPGDAALGSFLEIGQRLGLRDASSGEPLKPEESPFLRALQGEAMTRELLVPSPPGGESRYLRTDAAPVSLEGDIIGAVCISTDITEQKLHEREEHFLTQVGTLLASTLDDEQALKSAAELVTCSLADCCIVELVEEDGRVRRLTVAHRDPAKARLADFLRQVPLDRRRPYLLGSVMRTRRPELLSEVPQGFLESVAQSEQHLQALRELNRACPALPGRPGGHPGPGRCPGGGGT